MSQHRDQLVLPQIIKPFGNMFVVFGLPPDMPLPGGCVRGEEVADLEKQIVSVWDDEWLRLLGINS